MRESVIYTNEKQTLRGGSTQYLENKSNMTSTVYIYDLVWYKGMSLCWENPQDPASQKFTGSFSEPC